MSAQQDYNSDSEIDSDIENLLYSQLHYATDAIVDEKSELVNDNVNHHNNLDPGKESSENLQQQVAEDTNDHWKIIEKDLQGAEDYNKSLSNLKRYYKDEPKKGYMCYNCKTRGHLSKDCPEPLRKKTCYLCGEEGHVRKDCPNDVCYNCFEIGHISKFCDEPKKNFYAVCKRCWGRGHNKRACPEIWRQYHLTVADNGKLIKPKKSKNGMLAGIKETRYCYNCGLEGHFGHDCEQQRQSRRAVSSPFIVYYDKCPYKPIQEEAKDNRTNEQPGRSSLLEKKNSSKTKDSSRKTKESGDIENKIDRKKESSREQEKQSSSRHVTIVRKGNGKTNTRITFEDKDNEDYYSGKSEERKNDFVGSRMEDSSRSSRKSRNDRGNDDKGIDRIVISSDSDHSKSAKKNTSSRDAGTRSKGVEKDRVRSSEQKSWMEKSERAKKNEPLVFIDDRSRKKESRVSGYVVISSSDNGEDVAMDLQNSRKRQSARDNKRVENIVSSSDSTDTEVNKPRREPKPIWCTEKEDGVTDRANPRKRKWRTSDEKPEKPDETTRKKINRNNLKVSFEKHGGRRGGNSGNLVSDVDGSGSKATDSSHPKEAGVPVHDNEATDEYFDDFIELDVYESFSDNDKDFATPDNDTKKATFEIPTDETENRKESEGDKSVEKPNAESFSVISSKKYDVPKENDTKSKYATKSSKKDNTDAVPKKNDIISKDATTAEYCHVHPERRGFVDSARDCDKDNGSSAGSVSKESDKPGKKRKRFKIIDRSSESGRENAEKTSDATSCQVSSDNNKASLSTLDKADRKTRDRRERADKKRSNATSTGVSSDLDKTSSSSLDKVSMHPERQQLINCFDFLDSDANGRSEDANERLNKSASSRNVSCVNDKAPLYTLDRVNLHPERQQLVSSFELPYSEVNRGNRPETFDANHSYIPERNTRSKAGLDKETRNPRLGEEYVMNADVLYLDVNDRRQDTESLERDRYIQNEDNRGSGHQSSQLQSKQSKVKNKRNVYVQRDEDVSDQCYYEDVDVNNFLSTSTESRDFGPGNQEKKDKEQNFVFVNDDSATEEENFQFSNLLINRDGEVSSDEDDLRYKINTLKAKRQRNASPERSGQVESDTFNDPDEIEPFMYEREATEYDGYSGDMQEENLVPNEPRQVDFTMYDPNEAYEGDLSYYGLGNQETYSRRHDERFKEPEHVVFVENEDGEDDNDGNKASIKMTRRKGALHPSPKVKRLQNVSKPKEVKSGPFSLPKEIKSNPYIVRRNQAIVERHAALWEDDDSEERVEAKSRSNHDTLDPELKDRLMKEKLENVNFRQLPLKLKTKGLALKKRLLEKRTSKERSKLRLSWKRFILKFFGIPPKTAQSYLEESQQQQQKQHDEQQHEKKQQKKQKQKQKRQQKQQQKQQQSQMTKTNDNGDNVNVIDLTTPVKNSKGGRNKNRNKQRRNRAAAKNPTDQSKNPIGKSKDIEASPNTSGKKGFVNRKSRYYQNKDRGFKTSDSAKNLLTLGGNYL